MAFAVSICAPLSDPTKTRRPSIEGGRVAEIIEKPKDPPSNLAVIGVYMYDNQVLDIVSGLKRSARGELEITDVNNAYLKRGQLECEEIDGWWTNAGTFESLFHANQLVHQSRAKTAR